MHSAQGLTVDTSHTVATGRTGPAALYVGLSRGRRTTPPTSSPSPSPPTHPPAPSTRSPGKTRSPCSPATPNAPTPNCAAIVEAEQSAAEAGSLRTAVERFTDAAEVATAGRTAAMLDRLVDDGTLTPAQRASLAGDDGMVSLSTVLRQAEIAGHDPHQVLRDAVASRHLGDARSLASVLHHRITDSLDLHPAGDRYTDWTPTVDDPHWQRHLNDLAAAADARRTQLGREIAETRPQWAIDALGPVPETSDEARRHGCDVPGQSRRTES